MEDIRQCHALEQFQRVQVIRPMIPPQDRTLPLKKVFMVYCVYPSDDTPWKKCSTWRQRYLKLKDIIMCKFKEDFIEGGSPANCRMLHQAVTHIVVLRCGMLPVIEDHALKHGRASGLAVLNENSVIDSIGAMQWLPTREYTMNTG